MTRSKSSGPAIEHTRGAARVKRAMALCGVVLLVALNGGIAAGAPPPGFDESRDVWRTAVAPAACRAGDPVETGLQGEVPLDDRDSGRSTKGYACNIDLVGQYQGQGAGFTSASYKNCVYFGSTFPHTEGVDAGDPALPYP